MNKILYFLASVDQELKRRRPDGTPYFNLRVCLIFIMFLHYFQLAMIEKARGVETVPHSKNLFVIGLLVVSTFIYFYIGILFPLDQIVNKHFYTYPLVLTNGYKIHPEWV